jgi:hypothetical protein
MSSCPLPAAPVAAWLYANPQFRISREPTASGVSSTLFPLAPAIQSASSCRYLVGHATYAHAAELSALRRNHASSRAALRRATPPPISASSHPVRSMSPHLRPRISLVLRHAHWFFVSHLLRMQYGCALQTLRRAAPHHSLCDHQRRPKCTDSGGNFANDQYWLIHIQIP